jgi:hypothetical protein
LIWKGQKRFAYVPRQPPTKQRLNWYHHTLVTHLR